MKVVIVSDFAVRNGGTAQVAIGSAIALAEAGVDVTYVHGTEGLERDLARSDVHCIGLNLESVWDKGAMAAARQGVWNADAAARLATVLADFSLEETVVHVHQWTKALSPSIFSALAKLRFRTVVTMHDYFLVCPNGAYLNFSNLTPCDRRPMSMKCCLTSCDSRSFAHKVIRIARHMRTERALAQFETLEVVHLNEFALGIARPFLPPNSRNYIVRNPISIRKEYRVEVERNSGFLFVGRFVPEKGCILAAEAARKAGLPITFIGAGPAEAKIRTANPNAEIRPWGDQEMVIRALRRVKALVFPSLWYETSGLVVGEAVAHGIPAIVSDKTGATDWIPDVEQTAILKVSPTVDALAEALVAVHCRTDLADLSRRVYDAYWKRPASLDAHCAALTRLYHNSLPEARIA